MMDTFENYSPSKWLKDGLVVLLRSQEPKPAGNSGRSGKLSIALSSAVLTVALGSVNMAVLAEPVSVGNIGAVEISIPIPQDRDSVPSGYWAKLLSAVRSTPRLPEQDKSYDPPALF